MVCGGSSSGSSSSSSSSGEDEVSFLPVTLRQRLSLSLSLSLSTASSSSSSSSLLYSTDRIHAALPCYLLILWSSRQISKITVSLFRGASLVSSHYSMLPHSTLCSISNTYDIRMASYLPPDSGVGVPPQSVEAITQTAQDYEYNPQISLRNWLRTASTLIREVSSSICWNRRG